jgi:hypothetical protein
MLSAGNQRATPNQAMWPLICHEIGLSYEQEEKVRLFQRSLLSNHESWLDRHTATASRYIHRILPGAISAVINTTDQRERKGLSVLSSTQKLKFLSFASQHRTRIFDRTIARTSDLKNHVDQGLLDPSFRIKPQDQHVAVNLYILHHQLRRIFDVIPTVPPLLSRLALKRLSRRPSFESLGGQLEGNTSTKGGGNSKAPNTILSRDVSFPSTGSLKRVASEAMMDDHENHSLSSSSCLHGDRGTMHGGDSHHRTTSIRPEDYQAAAASWMEQILGFIQSIMPPPVPVVSSRSVDHLVHHHHHQRPAVQDYRCKNKMSDSNILTSTQDDESAPFCLSSSNTPVMKNHKAAPKRGNGRGRPPKHISTPDMMTIPISHRAPVQAIEPMFDPLSPVEPSLIADPLRYNNDGVPSSLPSVATAPASLYSMSGNPVADPMISSLAYSTTMTSSFTTPPPPPLSNTSGQHRHVRQSSFLPPHLNVVPEELWPADGTDEFLLDFVDGEDWIIGQGVDMELDGL